MVVNQSGSVAMKTVVLISPEEIDRASTKAVDYRQPGADGLFNKTELDYNQRLRACESWSGLPVLLHPLGECREFV
jgi:hypothetical protein